MYCCLFRMNRFMHSYMSKTVRFSMKGLETKLSFVRLSPFFAVLAVVRQATDNFSLQQASNEILSLLGAFKKQWEELDRKSTRLNSSHGYISYAVFCFKKKKHRFVSRWALGQFEYRR